MCTTGCKRLHRSLIFILAFVATPLLLAQADRGTITGTVSDTSGAVVAGVDVTATQAVASMMAALTGAIAASGLGIAGTIIGAAFMSLASTVGSAIYKHYLTRSNERLRAAAASLAPKASHSAVASAVARHHAQPGPIQPGAAQPGGAQRGYELTGFMQEYLGRASRPSFR